MYKRQAYGQKYNANQTSSNMIERKISQGSQLTDSTPNVAEVISEFQDSSPGEPVEFATPEHAQQPMEENIPMVGKAVSKRQLSKYMAQKGLDKALIGAAIEKKLLNFEMLGGASSLDSDLIDHPDVKDVVGGEEPTPRLVNNSRSRTNLEDHHREMRRMDAMERNKQAINEIVEKTPSPSEMQVGRSPNVLAGKDQSTFEALTGEPNTEQKIMADQARSRIQQKTAYKQRMAGMSTPLVEQYYPSNVARTDFQIGGMTARKTGLPKSVGISYTPMNGETGVTYNIMNDPTKPLDVARTHFTATPEAVQQLLSKTGELGESSYGQQYNKGKRRMAGLGSMDESRIDNDNFLII